MLGARIILDPGDEQTIASALLRSAESNSSGGTDERSLGLLSFALNDPGMRSLEEAVDGSKCDNWVLAGPRPIERCCCRGVECPIRPLVAGMRSRFGSLLQSGFEPGKHAGLGPASSGSALFHASREHSLLLEAESLLSEWTERCAGCASNCGRVPRAMSVLDAVFSRLEADRDDFVMIPTVACSLLHLGGCPYSDVDYVRFHVEAPEDTKTDFRVLAASMWPRCTAGALQLSFPRGAVSVERGKTVCVLQEVFGTSVIAPPSPVLAGSGPAGFMAVGTESELTYSMLSVEDLGGLRVSSFIFPIVARGMAADPLASRSLNLFISQAVWQCVGGGDSLREERSTLLMGVLAAVEASGCHAGSISLYDELGNVESLRLSDVTGGSSRLPDFQTGLATADWCSRCYPTIPALSTAALVVVGVLCFFLDVGTFHFLYALVFGGPMAMYNTMRGSVVSYLTKPDVGWGLFGGVRSSPGFHAFSLVALGLTEALYDLGVPWGRVYGLATAVFFSVLSARITFISLKISMLRKISGMTDQVLRKDLGNLELIAGVGAYWLPGVPGTRCGEPPGDVAFMPLKLTKSDLKGDSVGHSFFWRGSVRIFTAKLCGDRGDGSTKR